MDFMMFQFFSYLPDNRTNSFVMLLLFHAFIRESGKFLTLFYHLPLLNEP